MRIGSAANALDRWLPSMGGLSVRIFASFLAVLLLLPVVIVVANLRDLNQTYERAARSLGARPLATFRTIIAPLVMPAFIVAAFFAFLTSFDDVVYVLFLGIGKLTTLPMRMWDGIKQDISPTISAVATMQMLVAATVIIIGAVLRRPKT